MPVAPPRFDQSPFQRFLGLTLLRAEEGLVEIRLKFREEFLRNDSSDGYHGGIVSALVDIAADYAIMTTVGVGVPRRSICASTTCGLRGGVIWSR
jgi:acyl-coenzyme A thioesterase PaaI-like protein